MKKLIAPLFFILALLFSFTAMAQEQVTVSLTASETTVSAGETVCFIFTLSHALDEDLKIRWTNQKDDELSLIVPAGETRAEYLVETPRSAKNSTVSLSLSGSNRYARGTARVAKVTVRGVPMATFSKDFIKTEIGSTITLRFTLEGAGNLAKGASIEIKDENNTSLFSGVYEGKSDFSCSFTASRDDRPMKTFSLYLNGRTSPDDTVRVFVGDPDEISIYGVRRDDGKIALTIDCGSTITYADKFLNILDEYGVKVTFFVTGYFAKNNPDLVREFIARGHEVGNHSYSHPHLLGAELDAIWNEVTRCNAKIEEVCGVTPTLYRPPYGDCNAKIRAVVEGAGLKVIRWSHSANDSDETLQEAWRSKFYMTRKIQGGSIILCHLDSRATCEALPEVLTWYKENGFEVVPVSQLLLQGDVTVDSDGYQCYR